jgi:hypothetical protein
MARLPGLAALRRAQRTSRAQRLTYVLAMYSRAGWWLAAALALLGVLLGWDRLTDAAGGAVDGLAHTARLIRAVGWLLLLLAAAGLVVSLALSSDGGRAAGRWLRPRLTARPVRWGAVAALVLVLLVLVVVVLPPRFTAHRHFDKAADELKAQNDVRTTVLQALAGGVLLLGAALTWRQLGVTREGQITDRYTKAVDQLGSDHLDVRVGGIYALERIARDSPNDRATIEEVLTAYVRDHAPWPPPPSPPSLQAVTQRLVTFAQRQRSVLQRRRAKNAAGPDQQGRPAGQKSQGPPADVQAAVTVLGRRELPPDGLRRLDLSRTDLQGAILNEANLQDANLMEANLQGAYLNDANLQGAWLVRANLQGAQLDIANLQGALLFYANLQGALFLDRADFDDAVAVEGTRWPGNWDRAEMEARGVRYPD